MEKKKIAALWCKKSKHWSANATSLCSNICNPFDYLKSELDDFYVEYLDTENHNEAEIRDAIDRIKPEILLLSVLTAGVDLAWKVVDFAKKINPALVDVWGGWHSFSSAPELIEQGASIVVKGPGENVLKKICSNPCDYLGIVDAHQFPRRWTTPRREQAGIFYFLGAAKNNHRAESLSVISGCPRYCHFCAASKTKINIRPDDYVIRELSEMKGRNINTMFLVDDNPMIFTDKFVNLCNMVETVFEGNTVRWRAYGDSSADINKIAEHFVRSGGINICIGLETAQEELLESYGAHVKQQKAKPNQVYSHWQEAGVYVTTSVIIGDPRFPTDTEKLLGYLEDAAPDSLTVFRLMPVKGARLWDELQEYLKDGISYGDLDQSNPGSFYRGLDIPLKEVSLELLKRYYYGDAYQTLIEKHINKRGKTSYLQDVSIIRSHLLEIGIDPWHRYEYYF
jgi:radical SAM superfamily enzyme YgiQ (UPF0313 family)